MAFTRVRGPGITTDDNYRVGILTATKFVGPMEASGDSDFTNISATGIGTIDGVKIGDPSGIVTASSSSGIVTYYGDASKLTGLTAGQIPNLDGAKITTGTVAAARIDNLAASKITSGTVATARLGSGTASSSTFLRGDNTWATSGPSTGDTYVKLRSGTAASNTGSNTFAGSGAGAALDGSSGDHNTFYGRSAGAANDGGQNNVFLGSNAGVSNVGGHENVAIGQAAYENGTGEKNIAIGRRALQATTSSDSSVGIGYEALKSQTSGGQSVAIGHEAAMTVTGSQNVAIGHVALKLGENTSHNTIVGAFAGDAITSGEGNTALGRNCLSNLQTGSNCIAIGRGASASSTSVSNEVTIGDGNITKFRVPGVKFEAQNDTYHFSCDHNLASWVQRYDGVWGNWSPNFNFKATGASPSGTTLGQWGNHQNGHALTFVKSRNNGNSGTSCQAGDDLGSIFWSPFNSANPGCSAAVKVMADSGTWSSTSNPAYMQIMTTPNGDKEPTERIRIASSGNVGIEKTSPESKLTVYSTERHIQQLEAQTGITAGTTSGTIYRQQYTTTAGSSRRMGFFGIKRIGGTGDQRANFVMEMCPDNSTNLGLSAPASSTTAFEFQTNGKMWVKNGGGIDFSAQTTTSASGAAASTGADEVLDHYEKGDWDPTIYGHLGGGSFGINSRYGRYIRIGHLVSAWGYINWASTGGNGVVNIGGLPFTPNNISANNSAVVIGSRAGISYPRVVGQMYHTGYINVQYIDASSPYNSFNVSVGALQSSGNIRFRLQYEVA